MCAIVGVFGHKRAANLAYLMLYALQHRGQESSGIASSGGKELCLWKQMGLVAEVFKEKTLDTLRGTMAIGHNRYSTAGSSCLTNAQQLLANYPYGPVAVVHNGNIVNASELRKTLEKKGAIFQSTSDSEVILHLIAHSQEKKFVDKVSESLSQLKGAYSLLILTNETIIVARDPLGFHPLAIGKLGNTYLLASETCAFDLVGGKYLRDVEPGEILVISDGDLKSLYPFPRQDHFAFCVFELIYFARPDSFIFGESVYNFQKKLGIELSKKDLVDADIAFPVPDSSNVAGLGYATAKGIPFEFAITRNHYVGRTFIEPEEGIRHFGVKIKLNPVRTILAGKKVVVVDDSIVRGITSQKIVSMIYRARAKEVHFRVSCPRIIDSCFFGIDTPNRKELIASFNDDEKVCRKIGAKTLRYQTLEGLRSVVRYESDNYCYACLDSNYPISIPDFLRGGKIL